MMKSKFKVKNSKLKVVFLLSAFYFLLFTFYIPVSAHLAGQPPFLEINGEYANLYPVPLTSLYTFDLPQDIAPGSYLVNQPISFKLDGSRLPAKPEIVQKTKFDWDFIDGSHGQGLELTHTFSKNGSYIVKIYADDGTTPKPQILESVLVNVLPDKNYQLPKAKILVNGQESKDPLTDILSANFQDKVLLDGSKSTASGEIKEYFWDFGDQKSNLGPTLTHTYPNDLSQVFVVLRVKDNNGFISDSFVEVQNNQNAKNELATPTVKATKKPNIFPAVFGGLLVLFILLFLSKKIVKK